MERNQPVLPDSLKQLLPLSYNLWFSWNADAVKLYEQIDPERWEKVNHNPVRMVLETSAEAWDRLASDSSYLELYSKVAAQWEQYESRKAWYGEKHPEAGGTIAYFSAEFGFHESLPIYSGGLGILAGDHCKSASDLGLPFVGVGLLYRKGYFQQRLDSSGSQQALRVDYDFNQLPVRPVQIGGSDVIVEAGVGDSQVKLKVWVVQVGRVPLYLLDADLESNSPQDRELTSQLYGGTRICGSRRRSSSASAGSKPCAPSACSRTCTISTKGMPPSSPWRE
ncbi:DUF3417 domain-containing protein [Paenibacillus sp. CC-CFT747]|nr:DUF3417 domain-containing protein [Paenibacillus sp. CC-CFT747]